MIKESRATSLLYGANAPFVEGLYEQYLKDPQSVEPRWRGYFDELQALDDGPADVTHADVQQRFVDLARNRRPAISNEATQKNLQKQFAVMQLISAYRFQGNRIAEVDPLKRSEKPVIAELDPAHYGLGESDMDTVFDTGTLHGPARATLREILQALRDTYCRSIGVEYMYMSDIPQKRWMSERLEPTRGQPNFSAEYKKHLQKQD